MNKSPSPVAVPETATVWILTAQIKRLGPNLTLWAPRHEDSDDPPFRHHEEVLGESRMGPVPMTLVESPRIVPVSSLPALPEYRFIRRLSEEDAPRLRNLAERESAMLAFVRDRATARSLPMIFVDAVGNMAANDFLLYYTADGRIDFRELLKDIHGRYRGRIELRQISPREHTSLLDGIGACGKTLCCSSFLKSFRTISTRMAREAESDLNSLRSTGMCGRLKCCLSFDGAASSEDGGEGCGSCCSKKSRKEEWVPVTAPSDSHPSTPPEPVRNPDNRYRKDPRSRG